MALFAWQIFRFFRLPVAPFVRFTGYYQFCAGKDVASSAEVTSKMAVFRVKSVLDYANEHATNETDFEDNTAVILQTIGAAAQNDTYPFAVLKPTALGAFSLFEKRANGIALTNLEVAAWERTKNRLEECAKLAAASGIVLMIDAEESWIQPGVDALVLPLMKTYNQKRVVVAITLQLYLKGTFDRYKRLSAEAKDYFLGVKLVRGAYMEKERQRAETLGIPSPVCDTKAQTDTQYRQALELALEKLSRNLCIVATHNESDIDWVVQACKQRNIPQNHKNLWFSQLYGMRDYISFDLAAQRANVFKYVPFGPLAQSIPYLIRRALENSSMKAQTAREQTMIKKELRLRKVNA
ncbi:MAG: proline dehydrogenase family protein [Flavobacteriaceae bacterium]